MQVFTLGMPAIGPRSTVSWQSVHRACFAMCVLCGNGIGWVAFGCALKKSRAASPKVRRAGENTDEDTCDSGGVVHANAPDTHTTARTPTGLTSSATATRAAPALRPAVRVRFIYLPGPMLRR